ncbi:YggS family pyridoxal phosphate-dependent enzyme [Litorimonas haliclonae]|uniref:YggS family pyridoxal phosphate-dependent enzyme n=1 Tax=Litorimonas haliclonae TaxID=2081977 RepID=UPI0039EF2747
MPDTTTPDTITSDIKSKREEILNRMAEAARRAERSADETALVAISKVQPDARIAAMLETGQKVFGENRVQEAQTRWGKTFASQRDGLELRLVGPLQSNKTQDAVDLFDVIETVDREKLLKTLAKAREASETFPRLFVQVNTGEESQKSGVAPKDVLGFIKKMREEYKLTPEGLMCIPPLKEAPSPHFWLLNKLAAKVGVDKLSMGMSADFETAIEMGATSVRVGSALFGERDYS